MFSAAFNVFTVAGDTRIEGVMWLRLRSEVRGWIEVEMTSPYTGLCDTASIKRGKVKFNNKEFDPDEEDPAGIILTFLYNACVSFENNIEVIRERYNFHKCCDEYEAHCINIEERRFLKERMDILHDKYMNNEISHLPREYHDLVDEFEDIEMKIEGFRFPVYDEIPAICGMEIDDDLIKILIEKFI